MDGARAWIRRTTWLVAAAIAGWGGCGDDASGPDGDDAAGEWADADAVPDGRDAEDAADDAPFDGCPGDPPEWLCHADPPSTLLPPGTTELRFSVNSDEPATCRWALGAAAEYGAMTPFESGDGTRAHGATFAGLSTDPTTVNEVYVRCDPRPEEVLHLRYRVLADVNPSFPRTGNLWGWWGLRSVSLEHCARIDLFLGAEPPADEVRALRRMNPDVLVLGSINTVERSEWDEGEVPEEYWLKDVHGRRIEVWPGAWRLNLTKPEVAEFQARYAYQAMLDADLMLDGMFFDNFFTSQSWLDHDIYGTAVQLDANEDGVEDDPEWLDTAWRQGVYDELRAWRRWMPYAYASGHLPRPPDEELGTIFNGDSIGFLTADVLEGRRGFADLWATYHDWWSVRPAPSITMVESSPHDQIAYGYDYSPQEKIPASTLEFARTYHPFVRFGLAFTLTNDGYFAHEFGDTWHGNDWWYDELDHDLGRACGPAERVPVGTPSTDDLLDNGDFEGPLEGTWRLWADASTGAAATVTRDTTGAHGGAAAARIDVANPGDGTDWKVSFSQSDRAVVAGQSYDLSFWARADAAHEIAVGLQKGAPDWRNYGLWRRVTLSPEWRRYEITFEANETADDGRFQFAVGTRAGTVWLDDARIVEHPADVFRRTFQHGLVLLNGTRERQTIAVEPGYRRLLGDEAARWEWIVDDADPAFTASAEWTAAEYDSGEWRASGPFYHDWGPGCRRNDGTAGEAVWRLDVRADDRYTIDAWWPAAPESAGWSDRVVFEVVAGGAVAASAMLDQRTGGDEWHRVAEVELRAADDPQVRVRNAGTGPAIADALHVRSASRYNDGTPVTSVTLEPLDGIILQREGGLPPGCP